MSMKICCIVVTYNRLALLQECIASLRNQTYWLDEIIVVNNSGTDGTLNWLNSQKDITVITQENSGSAGGQYTGIKTAYEKGYDWIWCMDDDCIPEQDSLERLTKYFNQKEYFAISPVVKNKDGEISFDHRGNFNWKKISPIRLQIPLCLSDYSTLHVEIDFTSFVGSVFNRLAIGKCGYPNQKFFLHHDDTEYSIRLNSFGKALLVTSSIINHKEDAKQTYSLKRRFLWKVSYRMPFEKFWLSYYSNRNYFWLLKEHVSNKFIFYWITLYRLFMLIRRIILYDDHKIKRIQLTLLGMKHGNNNYFNNKYPKNFLYGSKSK